MYTRKKIINVLVVVLFVSVLVPAFTQESRYISRFEAAEMIEGEWEQYGSQDLDQGDSHIFSEPTLIEFFPDGSYTVETSSGDEHQGSWEVLEIDHRPWIRMSLESVQKHRTSKIIFSGGDMKLHDPFFLSGVKGFDTELFRRPDR
ncbi:MAG: hypothetical protein ACLFNK_03960 [Candidatus Woesearchaeota archaeon]